MRSAKSLVDEAAAGSARMVQAMVAGDKPGAFRLRRDMRLTYARADLVDSVVTAADAWERTDGVEVARSLAEAIRALRGAG